MAGLWPAVDDKNGHWFRSGQLLPVLPVQSLHIVPSIDLDVQGGPLMGSGAL